jgi:hypothetical protein
MGVYSLKFKKTFILDFLLVFLLVLSGGSVAFVFYRNFFTLLLFGVILFKVINKSRFSKINFYSFLLNSFLLIVFLAFNFVSGIPGQGIQKFTFIFFNFLIALLILLSFKNTDNLLNTLRLILRVIMYHSLINFILYPVLKGGLVTIVNPFNDYTCSHFLYLFYYSYHNEMGLFCRNQGLFWEPGVLQIFLNLLFFLEVFIFKNNKKWMLLIMVIAILTTYSTTGFLILALQLLIYFKGIIRKKPFILPIVILLFIPFIYLMQANVEEKLYGDRASSSQIRFFDFFQQLLIIKENPITGLGLDDQIYAKSRANYVLNMEGIEFNSLEKGSTNSVLFLFAAGGIPFSLFLLYSLYKQNIIKNHKKLFFTLMILSLMGEPVFFKPFFLVFVVAGNFQIFKFSKI